MAITGRLKAPLAARMPAVNSRLSPGKKKPTNNPDSAKMMKNSPSVPKVFSSVSGSSDVSRPISRPKVSRSGVARAKPLGRQGEHEAAEEMARGAIRLIEPTDLLNAQGFALLDLAEVLALRSRPEEASAVAREAARRFEQKGNLPSLQRALRVANAPAPMVSLDGERTA